MQEKKQIKLPRGLRWHSESRFIWFTWRDAQGKQHQKSTETTDPMKAMLFKMVFLEKHKEAQSENEKEVADLSSLPLGEAAKLYFEWKSANGADATIVREKRIFKSIEKFFKLLDDYARRKYHCFVAELFLDKEHEYYVVCFRPESRAKNEDNRFDCMYLRIDPQSVQRMVGDKSVTSEIALNMDERLSKLGL